VIGHTPSIPTPDVARRERVHRRTVVLGLAVLLVLGIGPLVAHHLPVGLERPLAGREHLWALCMAALQAVAAPFHGLLHLLVVTGLAVATVDRARAVFAQRAVLRTLVAEPPVPGGPFWRAAAAAGLDPDRVRVVAGLPSPALTAGWLRPRFYVARALAGTLGASELEAVLAHEAAHAHRRDPLRLSLLRFLARTLFWLPAVGRLTEDLADEAEIRADDHAARGRPLALAAAIVSLAAWVRPGAPPHAGVGFDDRDLMARRVRRLAGEQVAPRSHLTRRSLAGAALTLLLVWSTGALAAEPTAGHGHGAAHGEHCEHEGSAALLHLFCLGLVFPASRQDCPHR
jgi:Zn-dependent protease with chaperone function